MGSIIGYRIDYNGVGVRRGQRHIPSKNWPKSPPPGSKVWKMVLKGPVEGFMLKREFGFAYFFGLGNGNWDTGTENLSMENCYFEWHFDNYIRIGKCDLGKNWAGIWDLYPPYRTLLEDVKHMVPQGPIAQQLSFEWSHVKFSFTSTKRWTTFRLYGMWRNKQYHRKVVLNIIQLNRYTLGFHPWTQK